MINPLVTPNAYDVIRLGGVISEGQAEVTNGASPRKIDVRKGNGLSGATTVFTGIDIKAFNVRLTFWDQAQIEWYGSIFAPLLALPPSGKSPKSLDFYHPLVSEPPINIRAVLVENVTQLLQTGDGIWTVDISLMPFRPPKPALAKPAAAAKKDAPKPQDANDKLIERLTKQVDELAKK